jgi:nudix-type nucleoside diphosphatase (YffH/AdpP family)
VVGADRDDTVRIRATEMLSENWHPLRKYRVTHGRRDGSAQTIEREVYFCGAAATVLAVTRDGAGVLLVRQFRLPVHLGGEPAWLVEACSGVIEDGQTPAETARREIEEETGFRLHDLREVLVVYASPGATTEKQHLFLAAYDPGERVGPGGGQRDEDEDIQVLQVPLARAWAMVQAGEIVDAKTVLLLQHLLLSQRDDRQPQAGSVGTPASASSLKPPALKTVL